MASNDATSKPMLRTSIPTAHASTLAAASQSPPTSPPKKQPKSISKPSTQNYNRNGKPAPNPRHLAIALQHAHQIQAQKDAEALILDRILELIALPSSPSADPAAPSTTDVTALKSALLPFQPADYDNLILERNVEGQCGYTLCPREHRKEDPKAKFRIMWGSKGSAENGRGREMKVVPREKLEMWCSDECAERAIYVRVQLAEEPVWERRAEDASSSKQILLLEEARALKRAKAAEKAKGKERLDGCDSSDAAEVADELEKLTVGEQSPSISQGLQELALERGDSNPTFRQKGRVDVQIMEKDTLQSSLEHVIPAAPILGPENQTGGSIEGYIPKERPPSSKPTKVGDEYEEIESKEDVLDLI